MLGEMSSIRICLRVALSVLLLNIFSACSAGRLDAVKLRVGDARFTAWVAKTPEQRAHGLMYRTELGATEGMLFIFEDDQIRSFWMKNTSLPLSIAFLSVDGEILQIEALAPFSEIPVESSDAVRYALEVNYGAFAESGAQVGDLIGFPENWP